MTAASYPRTAFERIRREHELQQQIINAQHRGDTPEALRLVRELQKLRDGGRP